MPENSVGLVEQLFVSIKGAPRENPSEIVVDADGVRDDKFYAKGANRSILIASMESYNLAQANGIKAPLGSLGENILISTNPYNLKEGDKIFVGKVILEITQYCTICNSLAKVDENLP